MKARRMKLFAFVSSCALMVGGAVALSMGNSRTASPVHAIDTDTDGYYLIKTADDFAAVFDGSAVYTTRNVRLANDLDLNGYEVSGRKMAGEFTAVFDGNGHTISNFVVKADGSLFNLVGSSGVIKNLGVSWSPRGVNSAGIAYNNNGLFDNCESTIVMDANSVFGVWGAGGFTFAPGSGTFKECVTNFVMNKTTDTADSGQFPAALVGNNGAGNTVTDCLYSISGTYASDNKIRPQSASLMTDVTGIAVSTDEVTVEPGANEVVTLTLTGNRYDSLAWTSNDETVATVVGNNKSATITGVAGGTTTVTVEVVVGANNYSKTIDVTVSAAASDVSAAALDKDSISKYKGQTETLELSFTAGTLYNSIEWSTGNSSIATVSGSNMNATVTMVAPGTTTIAATVHTNSGDVEATCSVTVLESVYLKIYFAVKQGFVNLGTDGWSVFVYGGAGTDQAFELVDTNKDVVIGEDVCDLHVALVDLTACGKYNTEGSSIINGVYLQLAGKVNTGARWGAGYGVLNDLNGYYLTVADWSTGASALTKISSAADTDSALEFIDDYMHPEISFSDKSSTPNCEANYNAAIAEAANLSAGARLAFKTTYYYERLQAWATANGESFEINGEGAVVSVLFTPMMTNTDSSIVAITIIALTISATSIIIIVALKKRHN